jgi:hypothetical protein
MFSPHTDTRKTFSIVKLTYIYIYNYSKIIRKVLHVPPNDRPLTTDGTITTVCKTLLYFITGAAI